MREPVAPGWPRPLLGDEIHEEVFEPAWHESRAEVLERRAGRGRAGWWFALKLRTVLLVIECVRLRAQRRGPHGRRRDGRMNQLMSDVRLALRMLVRRPVFAAVAVTTLALGLGANAAIFSVVNGVLLKTLPFPDATSLVTMEITGPQRTPVSLSIPNHRDWRERNRTFVGMAGAARWSMVRRTPDGATVATVQITIGDFFEVLGVPALIGRTYSADEAQPGREAVAVLTYGYWQREFGGDPAVAGRAIELDGSPYTIIGVLPAGFTYPDAETEIYAPMGPMSNLPWNDRMSSFGGRPIARLASGVTLSAAQADMDRITREIEAEEGRPGATVELRELGGFVRGDSGTGYLVLMCAVAFVLLIAGVNVASLLLARGEERRREMGVRAALGASRTAIVRQLVIEAVVLAVTGALIGLMLALGGVALIRRWMPLPPIFEEQVGIDATVVAFTAGLALLAGFAFGLLPALRSGMTPDSTVLREGARGTATPSRHRVRSALVVTEMALAVVLLVGAGLMLSSLVALRGADIGYTATDVLTARVSPAPDDYSDRESWYGFFETLEARLASERSVRTASSSLLVPLASRSWELLLQPEGEVFAVDEGESVLYNIVSPSWFETMGVGILRGRGFDERDRNGTPPVTIIDQTLADRYWPGADPIGRRVTFQWSVNEAGDTVPIWRTVIGVVPNVRHYDMREPSRIQVYVPLAQSGRTWGGSLFVAVRTADAIGFVPRLRSVVSGLSRNAALYQVSTLDGYVAEDMARETALGGLLTIFGVVALGLAAIGVFGVMSLLVAQRTREIGVRLAIGARPPQVLGMVLGRTLALAGAGVALGLVAAGAVSRVLSAFLYGLNPLNPVVYASAGMFLLATAAGAALIPAVRAARIDPMRTLREEA